MVNFVNGFELCEKIFAIDINVKVCYMSSGEINREALREAHPDKVWIIYAVCINCNKRFTSMRAISMHLKMTATRHVVNFINYGGYNKKTGSPRKIVLCVQYRTQRSQTSYLWYTYLNVNGCWDKIYLGR